MHAATQPPLPDPGFDLQAPGTYLYAGPDSTRGYRLNRFALSLKSPANRAAFLADEGSYVERFALTPADRALVRARDWTGLILAGGHLQAVLKLAATLGLDIYDVGAHNVGTDRDTLYAACPRRVAGRPGEA
jgi:protocatechuate 4,5-dioxygenase alpha chain